MHIAREIDHPVVHFDVFAVHAVFEQAVRVFHIERRQAAVFRPVHGAGFDIDRVFRRLNVDQAGEIFVSIPPLYGVVGPLHRRGRAVAVVIEVSAYIVVFRFGDGVPPRTVKGLLHQTPGIVRVDEVDVVLEIHGLSCPVSHVSVVLQIRREADVLIDGREPVDRSARLERNAEFHIRALQKELHVLFQRGGILKIHQGKIHRVFRDLHLIEAERAARVSHASEFDPAQRLVIEILAVIVDDLAEFAVFRREIEALFKAIFRIPLLCEVKRGIQPAGRFVIQQNVVVRSYIFIDFQRIRLSQSEFLFRALRPEIGKHGVRDGNFRRFFAGAAGGGARERKDAAHSHADPLFQLHDYLPFYPLSPPILMPPIICFWKHKNSRSGTRETTTHIAISWFCMLEDSPVFFT